MRHLKWLGGLALMALLLSRPQAAARGALQAMAHWYAAVAPALFPFLALMPLLTCGEAVAAYERLLGPAMKALFGLPGGAAPAVVAGMLGGMPAGALAARRVAARSGMDRGQLYRLAAAFSGFSPAFLVGGVGAGMLGSAAMGWKLLEAQVMSQILLALLLRRAWRGETGPVPPAPDAEEAQPVRAAVGAVLGVCGYMTLFGVLTAVAATFVGEAAAERLLCLMDVPSGALRIAGAALSDGEKLMALAALCGFGGMCVAAQGMAALKGCGLSATEYVSVRVLAAAVNAGCMAALLKAPAGGAAALAGALRRSPLALAALAASLLSFPVLAKIKKSIS